MNTLDVIALQEENDLPVSADTPLIGVISRLTEQKGCDLITRAFDRLMRTGVQFVLVGTGEPKYHQAFQRLARRYPEQTSVHLTFDNPMAHRIEAGADIFLMPSRFEPCGLNQMYSLRYGTVPLVRETGGLADTVENYHAGRRREGSGFVFKQARPGELLRTVRRALRVFRNRDAWRQLMRLGMKLDFSWDQAAGRYEEVFARLTEHSPAEGDPLATDP